MNTPALFRSIAAALLAAAGLACAPAQAVERAELEAAIVYNVLLFVEWPPDAAPSPGGALVLCVDPASALSAPLKSLAGRRVRSYRLELHELSANESTHGCHALYLDTSTRLPSGPQRRQLRGAPVLVIAEEPAAPEDAVAVRLGDNAGHIAFDVDLVAARQSGLQISSRLLRLARKVNE
jgi:hypothetical protein